MLVDKNELQKTLKVLTAFEKDGCPYVALQLPSDGKPLLYRVGREGFIQSKDYNPYDGLNPVYYISLKHFEDLLKYTQDDSLELYADNRNIIRLDSTNPSYPARFVVHTVKKDSTGMKTHVIGKPRHITIEPTAFNGIDVKPFHPQMASTSLYLKDGKLMIMLKTGVVFWEVPDCLKPIELSPKEAFLRLVGGNSLEDLFISSSGYWGAVSSNGMLAYVAGHTNGNHRLYQEYNAPGTLVATVEAKQLLYALNTASALCDKDRVDIDAKHGVMFRDKMGETSQVSIGSYDFPKFSIRGESAQSIVHALSQAKEDEAVLLKVDHPDTPIMRFKRGAFEMNVKVLV